MQKFFGKQKKSIIVNCKCFFKTSLCILYVFEQIEFYFKISLYLNCASRNCDKSLTKKLSPC